MIYVCWRANKPILAAQIEKLWRDDNELGSPGGIIPIIRHCQCSRFLEHLNCLPVDFLICCCWCASLVVTEDSKIQDRTLKNFCENRKEMVLTQLGVWMLTLPRAAPHGRPPNDFTPVAVQQIRSRRAMPGWPALGVTRAS